MAEVREALTRMSETHDYDVAEDNLYVRGWTVKTSDGQTVGEVADLVIDPSAMKVRYLEVTLSAPGGDQRTGVLVPIEAADLERSGKAVRVYGFTREELGGLPRYGSTLHQG